MSSRSRRKLTAIRRRSSWRNSRPTPFGGSDLSIKDASLSPYELQARPEQVIRGDASSTRAVSIVITTYNHSQFLPEAIESALGQTVRPVEVIVVDDGSSDDPGSVVSRYPEVQLIRQANQGLAAARNTGWQAARGSYVVFLDADDRLLPEALAANLRRFDARPDCAFVYGGYHYIDVGGRQLSSPAPKFLGKDAYASFLNDNCVAMHATVMYRRDYLEEAGGFDGRLRRCEDYDLYLRLARRYPVAAGSERIAEYRQHGNNMSLDYPAMFDTLLAILRRQSQHVVGHPQWRTALKTGIRNWKAIYADVQISQTLTVARASGLRHIPWRASAKMCARVPAPFLKATCRRISTALRSRLVRLRRRSVRFGDLRRLEPISRNFGFDRGKPMDRRYIEDFLSRYADDIRGRVLEVGDNAYTMQYGGDRVTRSDILHITADNPRATFVGDLAEGDNLPCEAFDCIVLTQTLQYVFDVHKAVATLHRMLKPGGVLLLTVPGVTSIDRGEWAASWYWSLSPLGLRRLLIGKFGEASVGVSSYGNVLAAIAFLHGLADHELRPSERDTHDPQYPVIVAARALKQ
jgi:glycosyltransferase involved in cell wall biosynthesis/SAM-dependent methyltransferase